MKDDQLKFLLDRYAFREMPRKKPDDATYIMTCPARIRWCSLAKPRAVQQKGQAPQLLPDGSPAPVRLLYDATFIIPAAANIDPLRAVVVRLMTERFGADYNATLVRPVTGLNGETIMVSSISGGVKKQAEMFAKKEAGFGDSGIYFSASCSSEYPPVIIGPKKDQATGTWIELDRAGPEVYPGMWVLANCKVYARPKKGLPLNNPGISFQLESLQKIADDTPFQTRSKVQGFDEIETHPGSAMNGAAGPAQAPVAPAGF